MNVLVTGARGFVGARVVAQLERDGHSAAALAGDVRDRTTHPAQKFDGVIHVASLISHRGDHSENELFDVNVNGTKALLESYPTANFVYVSTNDVQRATLSDYALSKLAAEQLVVGRAHSSVVRLPSIFGPNQRQQTKLIPLLIRAHVLGGKAPALTDEVRPCLFVDDAAVAICGGLTQTGLVIVKGIPIHNRVLDQLIAAGARGDTEDKAALDHPQLFAQLRTCVDAARQRGPSPAL